METIQSKLSRVLDTLSESKTIQQSAQADALHRAALNWEKIERLPLICSWPKADASKFESLPNGFIYKSAEAMLYNELCSAFDLNLIDRDAVCDDLSPSIRPNWGTVLIASVLGGCAEQQEDHTPWIRRKEGEAIGLESIAEADPDIALAGWIPRVLSTYQAYQDLLAPYSELKNIIHITLPDMQGPLDSVEQLTGADLFVEMIENPELVSKALKRTAEIQIACAHLFEPFVSDGPKGFTHQHGFLLKGNILIRCDSAVMISPQLYRDLVAPADELVLSSLGGGGIHSCGKIDFTVPEMLKQPSIKCFDFGQSYMNDIDSLYLQAREHKIPFLRIQPSREELETASICRRFPTGVSLYYPAQSLEEATNISQKYINAYQRGTR